MRTNLVINYYITETSKLFQSSLSSEENFFVTTASSKSELAALEYLIPRYVCLLRLQVKHESLAVSGAP